MLRHRDPGLKIRNLKFHQIHSQNFQIRFRIFWHNFIQIIGPLFAVLFWNKSILPTPHHGGFFIFKPPPPPPFIYGNSSYIRLFSTTFGLYYPLPPRMSSGVSLAMGQKWIFLGTTHYNEPLSLANITMWKPIKFGLHVHLEHTRQMARCIETLLW